VLLALRKTCRLYHSQQLVEAHTGNEVTILLNKEVRSDVHYWLDRSHNDPFHQALLRQMDLFVAHLSRTCYTGINGYEFHYNLYEEGSYYRKPLNQPRNNDSASTP
jgi:SM-20-related protein